MVPKFKRMVEGYLHPDSFAAMQPNWEYTVRSIYYETQRFDFYWEKMEGLKERKKFRIRGYNKGKDEDTVFLEIKNKNDGKILKTRAPMTFATAKSLVADGNLDKWLPKETTKGSCRKDAMAFLFHLHQHQLEPLVGVVYERLAYEAELDDVENKLRVTLDQNLRSVPYPRLDQLHDEFDVVPALPGHFILEVKYNKILPRWMARILHKLKIRRQAASKYCHCIDAHPRIDPNIRRDFGRNHFGHFIA